MLTRQPGTSPLNADIFDGSFLSITYVMLPAKLTVCSSDELNYRIYLYLLVFKKICRIFYRNVSTIRLSG